MARDFNGSTQYGQNTSSHPISAYPISMACWFNTDSTSGTHCIFEGLGKDSAAGALCIRHSGNNLQAHSNQTANATGTVTISTGTWTHAAAVFSAANSRIIYTNGADKQTNTASSAMIASPNRIAAGVQHQSTGLGLFFDGRVAEAAVWAATLDDAEVAALAKGISPLMIRPTSLVFYAPLLGNDSPEPDLWRNGLALTLTASPPKADHTRMYYPSSDTYSY